MEICTCCPTLRHASWQSCTVGASTVPVWHIHGMHKHSWWGTVFPNLQGQTPMVKWLKNGWIGWWMVIEEMMSFWERKAISSLKIKMLDLVMSKCVEVKGIDGFAPPGRCHGDQWSCLGDWNPRWHGGGGQIFFIQRSICWMFCDQVVE